MTGIAPPRFIFISFSQGGWGGPFWSEESPLFRNFLPVNFNVTAFAEIADHVPVQAGFIFVAGFGIASAEREVDGAADFFVEERVAGESLNRVIRADGAFA